MAFKWNTENPDVNLLEDNIELGKRPEKETGCNLYCSSDSPTCANLSREEFNAQQKIPACWDSIGELVLDDQ